MKPKKAKALAMKGKAIRQIGALPYRKQHSGDLEFMLITSRGTQRFVFPKGWRMKGKPNWRAAAAEARQEAGVEGNVDREPFGEYQYWKRIGTVFVLATVLLFPIEVTKVLISWREEKQRDRNWVTWEQARALIDEPELISLLDAFVASQRREPAEQT